MKKNLVKCAALPILIITCLMGNISTLDAQGPQFNHMTVYVVDLQKSSEFYEKVMQLKKIPEPFHDNRHIWFRVGEHGQLHVVGGAKETIPHDINVHMAFTVPSMKEFTSHLDEMNIRYGNWAGNPKQVQMRPDNVPQIYFQDPDGYWIEVNEDRF